MLDFIPFNPNPRGCITGDCVKRAIVVAADIDYKELELMMRRNKVVKDQPYNDTRNFSHIIDLLGGKAIKMNPPKGRLRWTANSIAKIVHQYPACGYVLQVSHHLIGIKDETIYDLTDDRRYDKGIYKMWVFGANKEELADIQQQCSEGAGGFTL